MKIGDSRVRGGPGVLPLQHQDYEKEGWPLWNRASMLAVRLLNRFDNRGGAGPANDGQLGWWEEDPETRGDVIGGQFWQRTSRDLGAWRFAWPVVTSAPVDDAPDGDQSRPSSRAAAGGSIQAGTVSGSSATGVPSAFGMFGIQTGGPGALTVTITDRKPVTNKPGATSSDGDATQERPVTGDGSSGCGSLDTSLMVPVKRGDWRPDDRLTTADYERPKGTTRHLWPKFPHEWFGISLQADHEEKQEDLFFPADPRMVAVHCHGDEAMGSLVCEMGPGFKVDERKMARLQSIFKVARKPSGCAINSREPAITWNIGDTGCKDSVGGLVWEAGKRSAPAGAARPVTGAAAVGGISTVTVARAAPNVTGGTVTGDASDGGGCPSGQYGHVSQKRSGFIELDCGAGHQIGTDGDGNPIFSAHLSLNSYFAAPGGGFDGPLKHDGIVTGAPPAPYPVDVQFGFDPGLAHTFVCGDKMGKQRWRSGCFMYKPPTDTPKDPPPPPPPEEPPGTPTPPITPGPPGVPDFPETPEIPETPEVPGPGETDEPFGDGEIGPSEFDPGSPPGGMFMPRPLPEAIPIGELTTDPGGILVNPAPGLIPLDELLGPALFSVASIAPDMTPDDFVSAYTTSDGMLPFAATTMEMGAPSFLARPMKVSAASPDWKNIDNPNINLLRNTVDAYTPITGRIEAFGAQGTKNGSTVLGSSYLWDYTHAPDTYRYQGGTADGGFVILPPEVGIEDVDANYAPPVAGAEMSSTVFIAGPGAEFGAGPPDLQRGGLNSGYSWRDDAGSLKFGTNYWSTRTDRICFDSSGKIGIGEMTPAADLHIKDSEVSPVNGDFITLESSGDSANDTFGIGFENVQGELAKIRCIQYGSGNAGRLQFQTSRLGTMFRWTNLDERGKWTFFDSLYAEQFSLDTTLDKFLTPAGTAADPVIASMADDNTGVYFPGADQFAVSTAGSMRSIWDRFGNFGVGTAVFGGGRGVVGIKNVVSAPSMTPLGGGVLYVESGALKFKGSSGTITTIAVA